MSSYTNAQLQDLWIQAGGNPSAAPTAAAIALAESGGNSSSANWTDPNGGSFGLWQINGVHNPLGSWASAAWIRSMYNPLTNARQAVSVSNNGTNWNPWTTYTSGAYLQHLTGAQSSQPISKMGARSPGQPGGSPSSSSASSTSSHNPFAINTWFGTVDLTNFVFLAIGLVVLLVGGFILVAGSINIPVLKGGSS